MAHITINAEECKACGLCIAFCPRDVIAFNDEMNSRGFHPATPVRIKQCTGCRICATMCPDICIEVYREEKAPAGTAGE